jgi:hypothetical protein
MSNTADATGGKPIAVWSQSISGVNDINPLVAFYDIHGRKGEVLFFYFVADTTWDYIAFVFYIFRNFVVDFYVPERMQWDVVRNHSEFQEYLFIR